MFADVAGVDDAIEELAEVREYLGEPERLATLGARPRPSTPRCAAWWTRLVSGPAGRSPKAGRRGGRRLALLERETLSANQHEYLQQRARRRRATPAGQGGGRSDPDDVEFRERWVVLVLGHDGHAQGRGRRRDPRVVHRHALMAVAEDDAQLRPLRRNRVVHRDGLSVSAAVSVASRRSRVARSPAARTPARSSPMVMAETARRSGRAASSSRRPTSRR